MSHRWRELNALLSANALSMIGNYLSVIAVPIFVLELTGSATFTATIVLAGQLPNLLVGLFSGHVIDRFSAKTVSLLSDSVNFFAIALIPFLFQVDLLNFFMLGSLVFLSQVMDAPGGTARKVIVPELIDRYALPRERVNGIDSLVENAADLLGPILASALLVGTSALFLLWVDALTFLVSFLIIAFGVRSHKTLRHEKSSEPFWKGWVWLFQKRQVAKLGVFDVLVNTIAAPLIALVLPVLATKMGEEYLWLGVWLSLFAVGTTLTTLTYTFIGHKISHLALLKVTPIGQAIGLGVVAGTLHFDLYLGFVGLGLLVYGMNLGVGSMVDAMLLQKQVPQEKRGRVFAAFSSFRYAGVPIGLFFSGLLLDINESALLFGVFVLMLIATSALWWRESSLT